jgi:Tfp pilus assembly protein PilN
LGLAVSALLLMTLAAHLYTQHGLEQLHQRVGLLRSSLRGINHQCDELGWALEKQEKILFALKQQQVWRQRFACHRRWLSELGAKLPLGVEVEKVALSSGRWQLVLRARRESSLIELTQALTSLEDLQQVSVSQMNSEGEQNVVRIEFNATTKCG